MDTSTLDLYNVLQSGPYDEAGLSQLKRLLGGQRRLLRGKNDLSALEQLIALLQDWAVAAGGGWLSASALAEAAEIAEIDLRNTARAEQLRSQAIVTGRTASGMPAPSAESVAMEGAIDANAELLHELKTLPPGALTQTLLTEPAEAEASLEPEADAARESSIPRPRSVPAPSIRSDSETIARSGALPAQRADAEAASDSSHAGSARSLAAQADDEEAANDTSPGWLLRSRPAARGDAETGSDQSATSAPLGEAETQHDSAFAGRPRPIAAPMFRADQDAESDSSFPARLRTTPPAALRAVTEARRSSSVPAQARGGGAAAASQARHPSVPAQMQPLRLSQLPQLAASEQQETAEEEHTQEVHTIDLELHPPLSVLPLTAAEPANDDALSTAIAEAERALDSDASPERVRGLAELYVKRDAPGDREQAADLFCTLGEVLGNPGGVAMLDRALALVPDHAEAKALLTRYAVRPRMPISSPKITVLGLQPRLAVPQPPPPAAAHGLPPSAAGLPPLGRMTAAGSRGPLATANAPQRLAAAPPPRASAAPLSVRAAARATLPGTGGTNDVLSLHGVPQVVTTRPSVPPISSLSPIVRSDASGLRARRLAVAKNSYVVMGGLALSVAAALGLYLSLRAPDNNHAAPLARSMSSEPAGQTGAASQPMAKPNEPTGQPETQPPAGEKALAGQARSGMPTPLAPPGPSHLPLLKLESAQLRGGKLSELQLAAALSKAQPKLLACYEQAIEKRPRIRGRVIYGFTVQPNGRATKIRRVGGTLKDDALLQCSTKVLEAVRFPKPRKASQVKLPIQYKRT